MGFQESYDLLSDSGFQIKVREAMVKSALAILGETPASPANTTLDDKRHALAEAVLVDIDMYAVRFREACASLGTLTTSSTDADVEFTVSAVWNDMAGVSGADLA
jgi:hypothetical protein